MPVINANSENIYAKIDPVLIMNYIKGQPRHCFSYRSHTQTYALHLWKVMREITNFGL